MVKGKASSWSPTLGRGQCFWPKRARRARSGSRSMASSRHGKPFKTLPVFSRHPGIAHILETAQSTNGGRPEGNIRRKVHSDGMIGNEQLRVQLGARASQIPSHSMIIVGGPSIGGRNMRPALQMDQQTRSYSSCGRTWPSGHVRLDRQFVDACSCVSARYCSCSATRSSGQCIF